MKRSSAATLVGGVLVVLAGLGTLAGMGQLGAGPHEGIISQPPSSPIAAPMIPDDAGPLVASAAALPVIDEALQVPEYTRDSFGAAWADVDGNGCKQRQDVLARDLVDVVVDGDGCTVLSGVLDDPYTGAPVAFEHDRIGGDSQAVQIDHVVSLSAAHRGGAWAWSDAERELFANDPAHLLAVEGIANQSKQDKGPGAWMPAEAFACEYAGLYVEIVTGAGLSVSIDDRAALVDTLTECASSAGEGSN